MITRVDAGTTRDFTRDEIDAMNHVDTSAALNAARRRAGQRGEDVPVRGDGGTLHGELEHKKMHVGVGETLATGVHALEIAGAVGIHIPLMHGPVAIVGVGVAAIVASQIALAEIQGTKSATGDAATRDTLAAGMLLSLELPSGFVAAEIGRLGVRTTNTDPAVKVRDQIVGTPIATALQLHCDQGVVAADDFLRSRQVSKEAFFAACPKLGERYAADAAYRSGFDALVWARANAPEDAERLMTDVQARDARYAAASIQYRI